MKVVHPFGSLVASGSIGGSTYARNRYGSYVRTKVIPVNPNTNLQAGVRGNFSLLNAAWGLLSTVNRDLWEAYAANTPSTDALGQTIMLPGRQWFIGNNALRLQAGLSVISAGPTTFGLCDLTTPTATITAGDDISLAFTAADTWANEVGGALLLYTSQAKAPTVNFCKGPFRYAGLVAGAGTPPSSPETIAPPFAYVADQKVFYRCIALTADGRVSAPIIQSTFCGA